MQTHRTLAFRGRRMRRDRALIMADVACAADGVDILHVDVGPGGAEAADRVASARERHPEVAISVATSHSEAARAACAAGADLLVLPAGVLDPEIVAVAAECGCGVVCPGEEHAAAAVTQGVGPDGIVVAVGAFDQYPADWPVLVTPTGKNPDRALTEVAVAAHRGARVIRTSDVARTRHVVEMVASIAGSRPPARVLRGLA